jgi:hypothetical protein
MAFRRKSLYRLSAALLSLGLPIAMFAAVSPGASASAVKSQGSSVTSSSLGNFSPTFVGPAATSCASGCNLLTGPFVTHGILRRGISEG